MSGNRFIRGFSRLGVLLAALPLLGALWCMTAYAIERLTRTPQQQASQQGGRCLFDDVPMATVAANQELLWWTVGLLALAIAVYATCYGIGWMIAGFARDS